MAKYSIVCLRHGESEWNKANLFCGWHDVNLSESGFYDASEISAAALRKENLQFDIAFTSCLKRAHQTLEIVLRELSLEKIPVVMDWRLNERHYGALTGFNKREMAEVYGEEQVQIWRRSFNVPPPDITPLNPYYEQIRGNPKFKKICNEDFPNAETLETTMKRVVPFYEEVIKEQVRTGKRVLIVAHGTSLRGLVKHVKGMTDEEVMKFNMPNSIPFVIELDENFKLVGDIKFLADKEFVLSAMEKVASIGK
ncbi:phosphoglycerate mutase 1-like [Culicoides brevitarsis]|uniref:phosphoglycerate mutase 1-like n=1 Tax=Culicoides brevitarsis TaxID=469753 RepID=UPI00307C7ACC